MAHTATADEATQTERADERPRLFSVDALTSDYLFGLPLLVWAWIAVTQSPLRNAISLGGYAVWVSAIWRCIGLDTVRCLPGQHGANTTDGQSRCSLLW